MCKIKIISQILRIRRGITFSTSVLLIFMKSIILLCDLLSVSFALHEGVLCFAYHSSPPHLAKHDAGTRAYVAAIEDI